MNVIVIEAPNFMQTPSQGVLLFANRLSINIYPEHWLLRDYAGRQFEKALAARVSEDPALTALTVISPSSPGFELPAIVYTMSDRTDQQLDAAYYAGLGQASKSHLRTLTVPVNTWGWSITKHYERQLRSLRAALAAQDKLTTNTLTQVLVTVDSAPARELAVKVLQEAFYDVI